MIITMIIITCELELSELCEEMLSVRLCARALVMESTDW